MTTCNFEQAKTAYCNMASKRIHISPNQITLVEPNIAKIYIGEKWHYVTITNEGFNDLLKMHGLTTRFYKAIDRVGHKNAFLMIMKLMGNTKLSNKKMVVMYDKATKTVNHIYDFDKLPNLNADVLFGLTENILSDSDMQLESIHVSKDSISMDIISKNEKGDAKLGNNELFNFGLHLEMNTTSIMSAFYNKRLICNNGAIVKDNLAHVKYVKPKDEEKFFAFVNTVRNSENFKESFFSKIGKSMQSNASLYDLNTAVNTIASNSDLDFDMAVAMLDVGNVYSEYRKYGNTIEIMHADTMRICPTNHNQYDIINAMTHFASHDVNNGMDMVNRHNIMSVAGKMMFKQDKITSKVNIPPIFIK